MYNILIVDDEIRIINLLNNIIPWKEYGFRIIDSANNGIDALEKLSKYEVDLLITDIKMPKMNGINLIEKCLDLYPNMKYIILSAHDEFEYVKKGIIFGVENYILKPINKNELIETLIKLEEKLDNKNLYSDLEFNSFKENILKRWIYGTIEDYEFEERAKYTNLPIEHNQYCVSIVKIFKNINTNDKLNDKLLFNKIEKIIKLSIKKLNYVMFQDKNNNFIILFYNQKQIKVINIKAILFSIVNNLKKNNINVFITIGSLVSSYLNVSKSYHESLSLLDYSLFMYKNQVISNSDISTNDKDLYNIDQIQFNNFKDSIINLDYKKSKEFLNNVFNEQIRPNTYNLNYIKNIIREILLQLSIIIKKESPHYIEIPKELNNLFEKYNYIQNSSNFIEYLIMVSNKTIEFLSDIRNQKSPIVNLVINYIKLNYSDSNLSLKTISDKFNVNSSYLGQLFKNETGLHFSSYLNDFRIDKSKSLIIENNLRLRDISKVIGYANQSYFQKVFKKTTGVSPSEFKKFLNNYS